MNYSAVVLVAASLQSLHTAVCETPDPEMIALNSLELAALSGIADQYPEQRAQLMAQSQIAKIVGRQNTGVGFFTNFSVPQDKALQIDLQSPIGDVWADIEGFLYPMGFLIFLRDGYVCELEGFAITDNTSSVEFGQVRFKMRTDSFVGILKRRGLPDEPR